MRSRPGAATTEEGCRSRSASTSALRRCALPSSTPARPTPVLRRFVEMPLPPGAVQGGDIVDQGAVTEAVERPVEAPPPAAQAGGGGHRQPAGDRPPGRRAPPRRGGTARGAALPGAGRHPDPGGGSRPRLRAPRGVRHPRRRPDAVHPGGGGAARDGGDAGGGGPQGRAAGALHRPAGLRPGAGGLRRRPDPRWRRPAGPARHRGFDVADRRGARGHHPVRPHPAHRRAPSSPRR